MKRFIPVFVACAFAALGAIVFGALRWWEVLAMSVTLQNLPSLLAPIAFGAAIVERGVEILISPWRDAEASKLETQLAALKAQPAADAAAVKQVSDELDDYRGATQRYAFAVSLILSTLVSIAGIRALGPFLDAAAFKSLAKDNPAQHGFFLCVDIALSATVLAGGADGIHSVVNSVTTFFDSTAAKTANS
jgi:hypothetical protein